MTYAYLDNFLGKHGERIVPSIRATRVWRNIDGPGAVRPHHDIAVRYHSTDVVVAHQNGTFTLNSGGYRTATTKERIKTYSPARLFQHKGQWLIRQNKPISHEHYDVPFYDGMRIDAAGNVLE